MLPKVKFRKLCLQHAFPTEIESRKNLFFGGAPSFGAFFFFLDHQKHAKRHKNLTHKDFQPLLVLGPFIIYVFFHNRGSIGVLYAPSSFVSVFPNRGSNLIATYLQHVILQ